jgi:hypothetical protein
MLSRSVVLPLAAAAIAADATCVYCCTPSADLVLVLLVVVCFAHPWLLMLLLPLLLLLPHLNHTQELDGCGRWPTDGRRPNGRPTTKRRPKGSGVGRACACCFPGQASCCARQPVCVGF